MDAHQPRRDQRAHDVEVRRHGVLGQRAVLHGPTGPGLDAQRGRGHHSSGLGLVSAAVEYLIEHALVVFAIWGLWSMAATQFTADEWLWDASALILGLGGQLLIDWDEWWLGPGMGGAAIFLMKIADLLLVTTDAVKQYVLKGGRR